MSKKPKIKLELEDDAGFEESQVENEKKRSRVPFSTRLDAGLYEKLRALSFWEDLQIADFLEPLLRQGIEQMEEQRGEAYEVLPPHQVNEDKYR